MNLQKRFYTTRSDYFKVKDQFGTYLDVTGMPCWEKLVKVSGPLGKEEYTTTKTYASDPSYNGSDIVFEDCLKIGKSAGAAETQQTLYVGGWEVAQYTLKLDWTSDPELERTSNEE